MNTINVIQNKKFAAIATLLTALGFIAAFFFTKNYARGVNFVIIYFPLVIAIGLLVSFSWIAVKLKMHNAIIRICYVLSILVNLALLGFILLHIDVFAISVIFPLFSVTSLFFGSVFFLIQSMKIK